jgi:hypothetical protein
VAAQLKRSPLVVALATCVGLAGLAVAPARAASVPGCDVTRPAVAYYPGDPTASVPGRPLLPCRYDTGARALEPSIGFTRDGRVLYQGWELQAGSAGGVPPRPVVKRSDQAYATWQDVSPLGPTDSLDPFLTVDKRTGRVFSVNWLGNGEPNCATVSHSDDGGDSWVSSPLACSGFDGESIGVGPPVSSATVDYPDLVYYCTGATLGSSPPATSPICSKSLDGGMTFVPTGMPPWPIAGGGGEEDEFGPWAGNPIVGPDGTVYVPKRFEGQPEVALSHDEGLSWSRVQVAANGSSGAATRMAIDDSANLYYAWTDANHMPYLATSQDGGTTWSSPIPLAPPGLREAALPRPAATASGRVLVAFLGSTDSPAEPPYYAFCNELLGECEDGAYADTTWNGYMTFIDDALAARPRLQTATVNPPDQPLFVGGCSADGACKADLDFIDAQFDPSGQPWAAFVDDCALTRDYTPIFGADAGPCSDFLGEGIVGRLVEDSYPRPKGATPILTSLVPAYEQCTSPNETHGPPLAVGSCAPPRQRSSRLTVGTPDSNSKPAKAIGSVRLDVVTGDPATPENEADVLIAVSMTDVRKGNGLSDYSGELQEVASARITDRDNGPAVTASATTEDIPLPATVPCARTADTSVGSSCSLATSLNALMPLAAVEGNRAIWQLGQIELFDGGADGEAETPDNSLFAVQGVFIP